MIVGDIDGTSFVPENLKRAAKIKEARHLIHEVCEHAQPLATCTAGSCPNLRAEQADAEQGRAGDSRD